MPAPPAPSPFPHHDIPCPRCHYNLRGMRGSVCPECGTPVGAWLLDPPIEYLKSRQFQATRAAAAVGCAIGATILLFEVPRTRYRHTTFEVVEVAIAGAGSLLIGVLWFFYARRVARLRPFRQGQIATVMWVLVTVFLLVAMGIR